MKSIQKIFEGKIYGVEKIQIALILVSILIIYLILSNQNKSVDSFTDTHVNHNKKIDHKHQQRRHKANNIGKQIKKIYTDTANMINKVRKHYIKIN